MNLSTEPALGVLNCRRLFAGLDQRHAAGAFAGLVADHLAAIRPASALVFPGELGGFRLALNLVARHLVFDLGHGDLDQFMAATTLPGLQAHDVAVTGFASAHVEGVPGLDRLGSGAGRL